MQCTRRATARGPPIAVADQRSSGVRRPAPLPARSTARCRAGGRVRAPARPARRGRRPAVTMPPSASGTPTTSAQTAVIGDRTRLTSAAARVSRPSTRAAVCTPAIVRAGAARGRGSPGRSVRVLVRVCHARVVRVLVLVDLAAVVVLVPVLDVFVVVPGVLVLMGDAVVVVLMAVLLGHGGTTPPRTVTVVTSRRPRSPTRTQTRTETTAARTTTRGRAEDARPRRSCWSRGAEDERFELSRGCPQHAFQVCRTFVRDGSFGSPRGSAGWRRHHPTADGRRRTRRQLRREM